jgi:hypothetical protein
MKVWRLDIETNTEFQSRKMFYKIYNIQSLTPFSGEFF